MSEVIKMKLVKYFAILWTLVYTALYPLVFQYATYSGMVFDGPRITAFQGFTFMALVFSIPFSMPLSVYLIWSRYLRGCYREAIFFCFLPFLTGFGAYFLNTILEGFSQSR